MIIGVAAIGLFAGIRQSASGATLVHVAWVGFVALTFILVRCLFYSLINIWLQWGLGRYVEPNNLLALFTIICLMFVAGGCLGRLVRKFRPSARRPAVADS